jgi:hypothetical protein
MILNDTANPPTPKMYSNEKLKNTKNFNESSDGHKRFKSQPRSIKDKVSKDKHWQ